MNVTADNSTRLLVNHQGLELSVTMEYKKLGEVLVERGVITNLQLSVALAAQQTSNRRLGEILVEKGFTSDRIISECIGEQFGYPIADLENIRPQPNALALLRPDEAIDMLVLPVSVTEDEFECVIHDPVDVVTTDTIAKMVRRRLKLSLAFSDSLREKIRECYGLDDSIASPDMVFPLPSRFGGLRARRMIGDVTLFDAVDHELDRKVTLASMLTGTPEERAWRLRVQAAARTTHPGIVAVHDWFEFDDRSWCVFERLEGETLAHVLRTRGARSLSQATETVASIAEGIDALHGKGGYVGLVCPSNVFITLSGPVLLPIAEPPAEYGSPEMEDGHLPTISCDLYALGTLLWECLHGENPHVAAANRAGVKRRWAEPQPHIGNLPSQLVEILGKAASIIPANRYPSALLLANSLRAYNWNALGKAMALPKNDGDRAELLTVLDNTDTGYEKRGFWKRLFGKAA